MKNYIPLILAVLLGVAAVLAVSRMIRSREKAPEETCVVTAAARNIQAGETLAMDAVMEKEIPVSARPAQATAWSMAPQLVGQKVWRPISVGNYVLLTDLEPSRTMVGEGEWAVTLNVDSRGIASLLRPGDEVAIMGSAPLGEKIASPDLSAAPERKERLVTTVLFPRVRILDILEKGGSGGAGERSVGEIMIGLKPQDAQILIAAEQTFKLTLALRRRGDNSATDRLEIGVVDHSETFDNMLKGVVPLSLSPSPGVAGKESEKRIDRIQ